LSEIRNIIVPAFSNVKAPTSSAATANNTTPQPASGSLATY
jgi:hypothetical protein